MAYLRRTASSKSNWMQIYDVIQKAEEMRLKDNTDEAKIYFTHAQEMNKVLQDQYLDALVLEGLGSCYAASDDYENATKMTNDAIVMFLKLSGPIGKLGHANGLLSFGGIYCRLGRYNEAIQYQEQATEILLEMRKEYSVPTRGKRKKKTIKKIPSYLQKT